MAENNWHCLKCGEELVNKKIVFDYLNHTFSETLPCCPKCGAVLILPELAQGKMAEVEKLLEEK